MLAMLNKAISHHGYAATLTTSSNSTTQQGITAKTRLKPVDIAPFDGKFTEYIPFISLFTSMIHNNESLDEIQKLYYLRSYLLGEPLDLIKNLPVTPSSYSEALKLLKDRYENKYKIVNAHIGHLLDLKHLSRSTATNLRDFVSTIKQQIAAINIHDPDVTHWDAILLCIFSRKLDTYTARAYQLDRDSNQKPSLEEFLRYLEKRALALENAEQGHTTGSAKVAAHTTQGSSSSCINHAVTQPAEHYVEAETALRTHCEWPAKVAASSYY